MSELNNLDPITYWLAVLLIAMLLLGLFIKLCIIINDFSVTLGHLTGEIRRTVGAERRYYIRQRRRLWLSLFPFVRFRKYN